MKILIIEDDLNVSMLLSKIIEDKELGTVIDRVHDGAKARESIVALKPDIVLIDFLMPQDDGISIVNETKKYCPDSNFIMISQVTAKELVAKAFESGIEYYVYKPVNAIEVETVIRKVIEKIEMNKKISIIKGLFGNDAIPDSFASEKNHAKTDDYEVEINRIFQSIGIFGEKGIDDIRTVIDYLMEKKLDLNKITLKEVCELHSDSPKAMEQRIRRTAIIGMKNLAALGLEDYLNETFVEYANSLYNFREVKRHMDFIRGNFKKQGKVNIKKFINGLVFYSEKSID